MKHFLKIAVWELKLSFKQGLVRWLWLVLLVAQGLALWRGLWVVQRHSAEVAALPSIQAEQRASIARQFSPQGEAGYVAYYDFQPTWRTPLPEATLSLGLLENVSQVLWIRLLGVEGQLYEGDLKSPLMQMLGTFDLSWVWCLLAPLCLLILLNDSLSRERERGALALLRLQAGTLPGWFFARIFSRWLLIVLPLVLGLLGALVAVPGLSFGAAFVWALPPLGALTLWATVGAWIALFFRTPLGSLVGALSVWLTLGVLWPSAVNMAASALHPVSGGLALTLAHRENTHAFWDKAKAPVRQRLIADEPQWSALPAFGEDFTWRWYYAMHRLADHSVAALKNTYETSLLNREKRVRKWLCLSPSALSLSLLHHRYRTDLSGHLEFRDAVRDYHRTLREYFFPLVFAEAEVRPDEYRSFPGFSAKQEERRSGMEILRPYWEACVVLFLFIAACGLLIRKELKLL